MNNVFREIRTWALLVAASLTIMSNATISPALPGLQEMFADEPDAALLTRLLVTAPSLIVALSAALMGLLVDRFGRRGPLLLGTLLYAFFGTAGLYLPDLYAILASRLALGMAVAIIMTAQSALIADYFSGPMRGSFIGYQTAASHLGGLVFVTVAGFLAAENARLPFAIYGLAALMIPLFWAALPEVHRSNSTGTSASDNDRAQPGWPLMVAVMAGSVALTMMLYYVVPTQIPYHLVSRGLDAPEIAGWALGALMVTGGISGLLYGRVRIQLGPVVTPFIGFVLFAAGFAGLAVTENVAGQYASAALTGSGIGFVMPTFMTTALQVAPARRRGLVAGIVTSSLFVGQFLSPLFSQPLVVRFGYEGMFLIVAGAMVLTGILLSCAMAFLIPREAERPAVLAT